MAAPRRPRWVFILLGFVVVGLVLWAVFGHKSPKPRTMPAVPVAVAKVTVEDVPATISALGTAQAWQGVTINAQVSGKLLYVATEGAEVGAGGLLAQIDSASYRAALMQAQGVLARDRALLQGAKVNLARFQALAAQDSIARQQVDDQTALVKQDEGLVLADQGAVAAAQVNVNYCRIVSPIAGRVGVRLVDPGNMVSPSSATGIVSVNQITPIAVTFTVPQGDFQRLADVSNGFTRPLATEAFSQETGEAAGRRRTHRRRQPRRPQHRHGAAEGRFPNAARRLWPGQFVNVRLTLQTLSRVTTVPAAAVNQGPNGPFVYVVGADNKVALRPVAVLDDPGYDRGDPVRPARRRDRGHRRPDVAASPALAVNVRPCGRRPERAPAR